MEPKTSAERRSLQKRERPELAAHLRLLVDATIISHDVRMHMAEEIAKMLRRCPNWEWCHRASMAFFELHQHLGLIGAGFEAERQIASSNIIRETLKEKLLKILIDYKDGRINSAKQLTLLKEVLEEISLKHDFYFKEIEDLIVKEMEANKVKNDIQKILFSMQRVKGKDYLIGTIFIPMLGMIKVNIDIAEKKITDFEKRSFLDMMKIFKKK